MSQEARRRSLQITFRLRPQCLRWRSAVILWRGTVLKRKRTRGHSNCKSMPYRSRSTETFRHLNLACLAILTTVLIGCTASRSYSGAVHGLSLEGVVQFVDLPGQRLTLAPLGSSAPVGFVLADTTRFGKGGEPIHADGVEEGQSVRVHYHGASQRLVAHHVYVRVP